MNFVAVAIVSANLIEKTLQLTISGNSPCFRWFNKETLWPPHSLENFFPQITKSRVQHITTGTEDTSSRMSEHLKSLKVKRITEKKVPKTVQDLF